VFVTNIDVLNDYTPTVVSNSSAFRFTGVTGLVMHDINVEGWYDELITISGGTYATLNGIRTERHRITKITNPNIIYLANGQYDVAGVGMDGMYCNHASGTPRLINADVGAQVSVR